MLPRLCKLHFAPPLKPAHLPTEVVDASHVENAQPAVHGALSDDVRGQGREDLAQLRQDGGNGVVEAVEVADEDVVLGRPICREAGWGHHWVLGEWAIW